MLTRQPVKVRRGRSARDVITGLAALVALVALVAGVPFALIAFFGSPLPQEVPRLETFTQELGAGTLLDVLVILVWLAWAQLAVCVIVEIYAGVRGVGLPARVPLSGGSQALAHRLVVAALLLFAASTAIMPAMGTGKVVDPPRPAHTQSQPVQQPPITPEAAAHHIAQDLGADPVPVHKEKARKIYRVQPPHGRHHESLWEIADKCLGDGRRYKEIYSLNKGKQQPDGSRLTIASLIRPGWILDMPDDAVGVETAPEPGDRGRGHDAGRQDGGGAETPRPQPPRHTPGPEASRPQAPGHTPGHVTPSPETSRPQAPAYTPPAFTPPPRRQAPGHVTPSPETSHPQGPGHVTPSPETSRPGGPGHAGPGHETSRPAPAMPSPGQGAFRPEPPQAEPRPAQPAPPAAPSPRPGVRPGDPGQQSPRPSPEPKTALPEDGAPPAASAPAPTETPAQRPDTGESQPPDAQVPGAVPPGPVRPSPSGPPSGPGPGTGRPEPAAPPASAPAPAPSGAHSPGAPAATPDPGRDAQGAAPAAPAPPGAAAPAGPERGPQAGPPSGSAADPQDGPERRGAQPPAAQAPAEQAPSPQAPETQAPEAQRPEAQAPEAQPDAQAPEAQAPAGAPQAPTGRPPGAVAPSAPAPAGQQPGVPGTDTTGTVPVAPGDTTSGDTTEVESEPADRGDLADWSQGLAAASLLAAGLLSALGRRRREQLWQRAFGRRIALPEDGAARAEQALRIGADTEATRLLDLSLRAMSKVLAAEGRTPPTVYGVHLSPAGLDLWIAPADRRPPEPWEEFDNGQVWRLSASALDGLNGRHFSDVLAPYPGLVSIGTNDTGRILVDLEAAHGLIAVRGPDEVRRAVLAALAIELATNRWSDHMRITLVGFGEELSLISPDRIRSVGTLAEALPELEARADEVRQALTASGADSVLTGRCRGMFGEAWMPHYLIMAEPPSEEEAERLVALARTGQRMAAGYLVAGDVPGATWTWDVDDEGGLHAGVLGFDVDAQLVPDRHYRAVVELFRTAGRVEGVPLPALGPDDEPTYAGVSGKHAVDVRLLGEVEVDAAGPVEESRRALCTEVLVYLATHPQGVHPTVLGGAVWPRGVSAAVRDSTIARVADWLGRDSQGRPNLFYDERGRIRLGSEVRVDWQTFRWLIWRSAAEPASETAYLAYALDLLRGPLLSGRPPGRYAWLAVEKLEYEATAWVSDIAHRLVLMRLDDAEYQAAITAARAGLRFAPDDEVLWRDLLRATHASGDQAALRDVVNDLRYRIESDPVMDQLQPETEALIDELLPEWRREPAPYRDIYGGGVPGHGVAAGGA